MFSHDFKQIAIGHDNKKSSDKFFGGGFAAEDAVRGLQTSETEAAYACGLRELEEESGIVENQLSLYMQIGEKTLSSVSNRDKSGECILLSRYTFFAVANKGVELPTHTKGELEMGDRRFAPIVNILRAGRLPRNHRDKFNPYHAQMLAETLLVVRTMASDGDPAFDQFLLQLHALKQIGFDINWYTSMIDEELRQRRI